ncbi:isoprenyl transferase [Clostridium sp. BJN0001]|uniref:isoprenyl transferase n=1 Tax=Clostridium sp. BJN0001 TaxID=2930219 RepID=UPI001FD55275|nr:isoprenyl transferase [Clostridium sp. BJN0001]
MFINSKEKSTEHELDFNNIPKHVAIIMDGNGRWAKKRNLPRSAGHKAGVKTVKKILIEAKKLGVKYLTLYTFSTENWARPKEEVSAIMKLLLLYLNSEMKECYKNGVRLRTIGDITKLPEAAQKAIKKFEDLTKDNTDINLVLALNYGGRNEIVNAVNSIVQDAKSGKLNEEVTEDIFSKYLYTKNIPDPDIIIRPSGEQRLSNFLLWECAYSELWYSNINWPDFKEEDLRRAIYDYQNRDRRFGKIK